MAKTVFSAHLKETMKNASHLAVLTGAGISAESGIPTFRDAQTGFWANYKAEELATPQAFFQNPALVWKWYAWRRSLCDQATVNSGHSALVRLAKKVSKFSLITQNVDNLHRKAGSKNILELHGNIYRQKCSRDGEIIENWKETEEIPPRCPNCQSFLRPDVVWFGETLCAQTLEAALKAAKKCDLFLSIGTSGLVTPAADLPYLALDHGATVIEINPHETPLSSRAQFTIKSPAGKALPALLQSVWP